MKTTTHKFTVDQLKTRLDKFLSEKLPELSRSKIQRDIEAGAVKVNSKLAELGKEVVRQGDKVSYKPIEDKEPGPVNIPLNTLYNQHGLLIIDKPAGLAVHPGAGFKGDSLAQALLFHFKDIKVVGEEGRHGIVHRLDKDTSGVMMIALTPEMYDYLRGAFKQRKVKKEYIALVCGKVEPSHGFIEKSIGKSKRDFRKHTTETDDMLLEKPSLTEYTVIEHLSDGIDNYTLIVVKLHTGRTHQIRVHFNSLGFPLVGDKLYGGKKAMKLGFNRQALHAKKIEVKLPDNTWIEAVSRLPEDFKEVLTKLESKKVRNL